MVVAFIIRAVRWLFDRNDQFVKKFADFVDKFNIRFDNTQTRWSFTAILLSISVFLLALSSSVPTYGAWTVILLIVGLSLLVLVILLSASFLRNPIVIDQTTKEIRKVNRTLTKELGKINKTLDEIKRTLDKK